MVNLRSYDLNLLVIFKAIMTSRSIMGAADQVGLSPSAVSHALSRLRIMLNDELFTRTPKGLVPSERALEIFEEIESGLSHIENAIELQQSFTPAKADRVFTMQIADYVSGLLLPPLAQRLATEAPGVSVQVLPFEPSPDASQPQADVQIRFISGRLEPKEVRSQRLLTDSFVIVMRHGHPALAKTMTPELYASLTHVKLSRAAAGTTLIDDTLASRGLKRHVAMTVPNWFDMPEIVAKTDMIAIIPRSWCDVDDRIAELSSVPLPLDEVGFSISLCWDVRRERDPGQRWFRGLIADVAASGQSALNGREGPGQK